MFQLSLMSYLRIFAILFIESEINVKTIPEILDQNPHDETNDIGRGEMFNGSF